MKCPLCNEQQSEFWVESREGKRYAQCNGCKLVWLDESQRPGAEAELARYLEHHNSPYSPGYLEYQGRTAFPLLKYLSPGAKGLDFGCGPVEGMAFLLSPLGFSLASYDPYFFPRSELLKFSYEFVLCSEVAEHFFQPDLEFARLDSLLAPGGYLAISSRLLVAREKFAEWYYRYDPTHVVFYAEATVRWIAARYGWKLLCLASPLWIFHKPARPEPRL